MLASVISDCHVIEIRGAIQLFELDEKLPYSTTSTSQFSERPRTYDLSLPAKMPLRMRFKPPSVGDDLQKRNDTEGEILEKESNSYLTYSLHAVRGAWPPTELRIIVNRGASVLLAAVGIPERKIFSDSRVRLAERGWPTDVARTSSISIWMSFSSCARRASNRFGGLMIGAGDTIRLSILIISHHSITVISIIK